MGTPVIVEAVRTPIGKRNGWLAGMKAPEIAARTRSSQVIDRAGIDPAIVDEVIGGCVTQAGEQGSNVTRNAWLAAATGSASRPRAPPSTRSADRRSRPTTWPPALIAAGGADVTIGVRRGGDDRTCRSART